MSGSETPGAVALVAASAGGGSSSQSEPTETPAAINAAAERRMVSIMAEVAELAPLLSPATLRDAEAQLQALAAAAPRQEHAEAAGEGNVSALAGGSPLQPEQLSYDNEDGVVTLAGGSDDARSEAGSVASLGGAAAPSEPDEGDTETAGSARLRLEESIDPGNDAPGWGDLDIDFGGLWNSAQDRGGYDSVQDFWDATLGDTDGGTRETRLVVGGQRDELGLNQHGRVVYCNYHDLQGGCANACMAVDMLQQRRIADVIEQHRRIKQRRPRDDPDGRVARHALYKAVVAWRWANPLGAENRVRLLCCVMYRVRRLFPNPCCSAGCDFSTRCEQAGHYTGFRTAEESRAIREGRFVGEDVRE